MNRYNGLSNKRKALLNSLHTEETFFVDADNLGKSGLNAHIIADMVHPLTLKWSTAAWEYSNEKSCAANHSEYYMGWNGHPSLGIWPEYYPLVEAWQVTKDQEDYVPLYVTKDPNKVIRFDGTTFNLDEIMPE